MKKYINSFRLFFGRSNINTMISFLITMAVMALVVAGLEMLSEGGDFTAGMSAGMSTMLAMVIPLTGMIFLNALYSYANPATPGRKYFLSVPDSTEQFRRAVIATNVFSVVLGLVLSALTGAALSLLGADPGMTFFGLVMMFAILGICNFIGFVRSAAARLVVVCFIFAGTGFSAGFMIGDSDSGTLTLAALYAKTPWLVFVLAGAAVLLFAGGFVYVVAVSRRKWEKR